MGSSSFCYNTLEIQYWETIKQLVSDRKGDISVSSDIKLEIFRTGKTHLGEIRENK